MILRTDIPKCRLEHEILEHFESNIEKYYFEDETEFECKYEIKKNGLIFNVEVVYNVSEDPIYNKDCIVVKQLINGKYIEVDFLLKTLNHNPKKVSLKSKIEKLMSEKDNERWKQLKEIEADEQHKSYLV